MASFDDVRKAGDAVAAVIAAGIIPAGLEMMDKPMTAAVEDFVHAGYDLSAEAILLCESDGTPEEVAEEIAHMTQVLRQAGATAISVSENERRCDFGRARNRPNHFARWPIPPSTASISTDIGMEYINVQGPLAAQQLLEDGSLTFSGASGNSLAVSDPDGEVSTYTLTASVAHGLLTPNLPLTPLINSPEPTLVANPLSGPAASYTFTGTLADINRALEGMVYTPDANYNGADALSLKLDDQGSNGQSGVCPSYPATPTPQLCDLSAQTQVPITITPVNDAPAGTNQSGITVAEFAAYTFSAADFGFTDPVDAANASGTNALLAVRISSLPTSGTLKLAGAAVTAGQTIALASIPQLTWTPTLGTTGTAAASFSFQLQDDGGTANGVST
ncbi:hypothetical protein FQA39_LY19124 [Lamprigera yunnana]|nr:hypothetical protein FQA39_LY19124 [Lamprigera yunnana]